MMRKHSLNDMRRLLFSACFTVCTLFGGTAHGEAAKAYGLYKFDKAASDRLANEIRLTTGISENLTPWIIQQIVGHSRVQKIGDWFILYNPAHELFIFVKQRGSSVDALHIATIDMANKYLNPSQTVRHEKDRLVRDFKEGPEFLKFWQYIVGDRKFNQFFDLAFRNWPRDVAENQKIAAVNILGPIGRLADADLADCFKFLAGDAWRSEPTLANLAALGPDVFSQFTQMDYYQQDQNNVAVLLGDRIYSRFFILVRASKDKTTCHPLGAVFFGE